MGTPTPQEIVDRLPGLFQPEAAGRTRLTVQLELTGDGGGHWWVRVADGRCTTGTGLLDRPDVTLTLTGGDYVEVRLGRLHPLTAVKDGRLKVAGRYGLAVKFTTMFRTDG
jgi:hypothetical protein